MKGKSPNYKYKESYDGLSGKERKKAIFTGHSVCYT